MARRAEPDYVSGVRGRYQIAVPVVHPPHCVCSVCPQHRAKVMQDIRAAWEAEERPFTKAEVELEAWSREITIRARRRCPEGPPRESRPSAAGYAQQVKRDEESKLRAAVAEAERKRLARAGAVPFKIVCDAYREHQKADGKRYDRDRYRIDAAEEFFGKMRDAASIDREAYLAYREYLVTPQHGEQPRGAATVVRYTTTLVAMMNSAVRDGILPGHQLSQIQRPRVKRKAKPIAFTRRQVEVLFGSAMLVFEREQAAALKQWNFQQTTRGTTPKEIKDRENRRLKERKGGEAKWLTKAPTVVPLRGLCLIAYLTLMRPANNLGLRWEQLDIHPRKDTGKFRLDEHKNSSKGVIVEGGLQPKLVRYLRPFYPGPGATGLVHPNPETGKPYVNIVKPWKRLVEIANGVLPADQQLTGKRAQFYTWRHTGASALAAIGADPVMIVRMMGDVSLKTVMDHYFDSSVEHMQEVLSRWEPPIGEEREERGEEGTTWTTN